MKKVEQMSETLQNFIQQWEVPSRLSSDSAILEISKAIKDRLCYYSIEDMQSEPNHQPQNYAKRKFKKLSLLSLLLWTE